MIPGPWFKQTRRVLEYGLGVRVLGFQVEFRADRI